MVFYLKLNRNLNYSIRNMQAWINAISMRSDAIVYVLCDNDILIERVKNEINFRNVKHEYLRSIKREIDKNLIESVAVPRWFNAAYAHLTPFIHSKEKRFDSFWNIDADDTMFGLSQERLNYALEVVENYAHDNSIDLFSLDMWRSRSCAMHWSFGITYTNGKVDWYELMEKHSKYTQGCCYFSNWNHPKNIDEYFTYLKSAEEGVTIETFYFENLMFLHYSDDFIMNPITSGAFKWKNGKLMFPIIQNIYGVDSLGKIDIANDVIRLDIGIKDDEAGFAFAKAAPFNIEAINIIDAKEFETIRNSEMCTRIRENVENLCSIMKNHRVYIFGFGRHTAFLINVLANKNIHPVCILDNAEVKWGTEVEGVIVKSPKELEKENMKEVIALVDVRFFGEIKQQLLEFGISENTIYHVVDFL